MKVVVVYSGGLDSTVALYLAVHNYGAENVKAISFNYQSKHNDEEFKRAENTCKTLGVELSRIDLSSVSKHLKSDLLKTGGEIPEGHYEQSNMKQTVVPFRNGIMLSIACGIAESHGAKYVMLGNHAGDHEIYPDCRATFITAMNEAMAYGTYDNINIASPFVTYSKADIVVEGSRLGVDWVNTYSCYKGGEVHCGKCSTCFERREAFWLAGVDDPTEYLDKTPFEELREQYLKELDQ